MTRWAIAYDLDVKGMKAGGFSASQVTGFYNEIRSCLASNHFEKFQQLSVYTSESPNSITDAIMACRAISALPNKNYVKRLNLFRMEDLNDLLPIIGVSSTSPEKDNIEEEIEQVFGKSS